MAQAGPRIQSVNSLLHPSRGPCFLAAMGRRVQEIPSRSWWTHQRAIEATPVAGVGSAAEARRGDAPASPQDPSR